MNRSATLLAATVFVAGCTAKSTDEIRESRAAVIVTSYTDPVSGLTFDVSDGFSPGEACGNDIVLGIRSSPGGCPVPAASGTGTWMGGAVFDPTLGSVPVAMRGYCRYLWEPTVPGTSPDLGALPTDGNPTWDAWLEPDCKAVTGLGSEIEDANATIMRDAFLEQVDAVAALPMAGGVGTVRVGLVDSSVNASAPLPGGGTSQHGPSLGKIINRLTCPSQGPGTKCVGGILSTLALPLIKVGDTWERDEDNGGYVGAYTDVAAAIYRLVRPNQGTSTRVVVNLSVGWDPRHGGDYESSPASLPLAQRAVHLALEYVACTGNIVIAAAGNYGGGPDQPSGGAYPAAWEAKEAPSPGRCASLGVNVPLPVPLTTYRPLVYAASGVDGADYTLATARPGSESRLVAPGKLATVADGANFTPVLTGSSVAAAVTAAAATIAWAYETTLSSYDVMQKVYDQAVSVGRTAQLCHVQPCTDSKRVSICRSLAAACAANGTCGSLAVCGPTARDARPTLVEPTGVVFDTVVSAANYGFTVGAPCNLDLFTNDPQDDNPCPADQFYTAAAAPFATPQPLGWTCPACGFSLQFHSVMLGIDEDIESRDLSEPKVRFFYSDGEIVEFDLPIDEQDLVAGALIKVTNFEFDEELVERAAMEMIIDGELATIEDLEQFE